MLGVMKILENSPCVKNVEIDMRSPCDRVALSTWEQRHCCNLPEEMRNFYASVDGFLLTWSLDISGEEFPVGKMEVGDLASLKRFVGTKEQQTTAESSRRDGLQLPSFSPRCKLFEIGQCGESKIILVYQITSDQCEPGIWLYHETKCQWHFITNNFINYFRMMLVHLGLPLWQYCVVGLSLPTWVEQVFFLVGPHLLPMTAKLKETISTTLWNDGPINVIDPTIFKGKENKQRILKKK
ncbi:tubulin polyglutamylase complex subunit 2 isoform X2 [Leptopilina boulardi]|nr:tubulin polyglutamylase complex subunit 2 isoform X2 [Leptopilina boulardi]